jgi:hypothetical protein
MKNLKNITVGVSLIMMMFMVFKTNAQETKTIKSDRYKLFCTTTSCCSLPFISIEVWSHTTCHYVRVEEVETKSNSNVSNQIVMTLGSNEEIPSILTLDEDVILAGLKTETGESLIMPKGEYKVVDGQISFEAKSVSLTRICYTKEVSGSFFGHDYEYSIDICVYVPEITIKSNDNKGAVSLALNLSKEQLIKLNEENNIIEFYEDITIEDENINFTLKAGKYKVNKNGNLYLQNVNLN